MQPLLLSAASTAAPGKSARSASSGLKLYEARQVQSWPEMAKSTVVWSCQKSNNKAHMKKTLLTTWLPRNPHKGHQKPANIQLCHA